MVQNVQRVKESEDYWEKIVKPDYTDFFAHLDDIRRAFHLSVSLLHLADWIYVAHKSAIDGTFTFKDASQQDRPVDSVPTFANALGDNCEEFELIRGIANASKHLSLTRPGRSANSPIHAANTSVQTTGYGQGGFGMGPYGGGARVMLAGPNGNDREFSDLANKVMTMWEDLSDTYQWNLSKRDP
ncbi:MAG: hypothetical protein C0606_03475 [Hyphomicrobiales bacterium]|nr:MAG: hypothetical protein C0606_03475 [Hyphomicrobiales bacterium]